MKVVRIALISTLIAAFAVTVFYGCWAWWAFIAAAFGWGTWAAYGTIQVYALGGYLATMVSYGLVHLAEAYAKEKAPTHADAVRKYRDGVVIEGDFRQC